MEKEQEREKALRRELGDGGVGRGDGGGGFCFPASHNEAGESLFAFRSKSALEESCSAAEHIRFVQKKDAETYLSPFARYTPTWSVVGEEEDKWEEKGRRGR